MNIFFQNKYVHSKLNWSLERKLSPSKDARLKIRLTFCQKFIQLVVIKLRMSLIELDICPLAEGLGLKFMPLPDLDTAYSVAVAVTCFFDQ